MSVAVVAAPARRRGTASPSRAVAPAARTAQGAARTGTAPARLARALLALAASCATAFATTTLARAAPVTYAIDPSHTFVWFEVRHQGVSTARGRFDRKHGSVVLDRAARTGRAEVVLETASITTGVGPFDGAMRGPNYFDSAQFPTATFVGERFVFEGERVVEVSGMLTLRGQTHPVTLRATYWACTINTTINREVCGGDFVGRIDRRDWGIVTKNPAVPEEVGLLVQVEGIRQAP